MAVLDPRDPLGQKAMLANRDQKVVPDTLDRKDHQEHLASKDPLDHRDILEQLASLVFLALPEKLETKAQMVNKAWMAHEDHQERLEMRDQLAHKDSPDTEAKTAHRDQLVVSALKEPQDQGDQLATMAAEGTPVDLVGTGMWGMKAQLAGPAPQGHQDDPANPAGKDPRALRGTKGIRVLGGRLETKGSTGKTGPTGNPATTEPRGVREFRARKDPRVTKATRDPPAQGDRQECKVTSGQKERTVVSADPGLRASLDPTATLALLEKMENPELQEWTASMALLVPLEKTDCKAMAAKQA